MSIFRNDICPNPSHYLISSHQFIFKNHFLAFHTWPFNFCVIFSIVERLMVYKISIFSYAFYDVTWFFFACYDHDVFFNLHYEFLYSLADFSVLWAFCRLRSHELPYVLNINWAMCYLRELHNKWQFLKTSTGK